MYIQILSIGSSSKIIPLWKLIFQLFKMDLFKENVDYVEAKRILDTDMSVELAYSKQSIAQSVLEKDILFL